MNCCTPAGSISASGGTSTSGGTGTVAFIGCIVPGTLTCYA